METGNGYLNENGYLRNNKEDYLNLQENLSFGEPTIYSDI